MKARPGSYEYDLFISHASEDKDTFVRSLADELAARGIRVWYDEFSLEIGDSLRESIDLGLRSSRYGVVVLSHSFFAKEWPRKELNGLMTLESGGRKVILPVWYGVDQDEVRKFSPMLADRVAAKSAGGPSQVANALARILGSPALRQDRSAERKASTLRPPTLVGTPPPTTIHAAHKRPSDTQSLEGSSTRLGQRIMQFVQERGDSREGSTLRLYSRMFGPEMIELATKLRKEGLTQLELALLYDRQKSVEEIENVAFFLKARLPGLLAQKRQD